MSVARERVHEDSRPFTAQRVRHPLRPDRTVHIIFWLDLTVIGLAGDVALLGARGLIQESYIEMGRPNRRRGRLEDWDHGSLATGLMGPSDVIWWASG